MQERMFFLQVPHIDIAVDAGGDYEIVLGVDLDSLDEGSGTLEPVDGLIVDTLVDIDVPLLVGQQVLSSMGVTDYFT